MAVTVKRANVSAQEEHPRGKAVVVREGHLFVLDGAGRDAATVAVHAAGQWRAAEIDEA